MREELAWAAGFMDGEGNFRYNDKRKYGKGIPVVQAAQIQREPLDRLVGVLGGKVYGPYSYRPEQQPYHTWSLGTFEKCQAAIAMLWPFLCSTKKAQAREALMQCV